MINKIERLVYDILDNSPSIKKMVRNIYQIACSIYPVKNNLLHEMIIRPFHFFGFHDKCPWSHDNKKLLTHKIINNQSKVRKKGDRLEIGFFSGENYTDYNRIDSTQSWNWQQGAMLQWVGSSNLVAFNDFDGEHNYTRILTTDGKEISNLERPIAAISPNGKYAVSYSFERLRTGMPGYEYLSGSEQEESKAIPLNDGLYIMYMTSQKISRIFSIEEIVNYDYLSSFKDSYHFFSHCIFSPANKRILFFHRWLRTNNVLDTRMISCDLNGQDIFIFPTDGMVSHVCWLDDNRIIAYAYTAKYGRKYYLFTDRSKKYSVIGNNHLINDGHPQVSFDKRYMITDTYPDRFRRQYLKLYDLQTMSLHNLAILRIPFSYRDEFRCDFHPRWDRSSKIISFDSAHTGIRSLCTIDLNEISRRCHFI